MRRLGTIDEVLAGEAEVAVVCGDAGWDTHDVFRRAQEPDLAGHVLFPGFVSDEELAKRRAAWKQPAPKYTRGLMGKYIRLVSTASKGAVTDSAE